MTNLYKTFEQDTQLEQDGIEVRYDDVRFIIARAGGSNEEFKKAFTERVKPFQSQIKRGTMDDDTAAELMADVYADTVVKSWGSIERNEKGEKVKVKGGIWKWIPKVPDRDGNLMPFTKENVMQVLLDLPELFKDLQFMASEASNYRRQAEEDDAKN